MAVLDYGVDWLTATTDKTGTAELYRAMRDLRERDTLTSKQAQFMGYVGLRGEGWFVGEREDGACARLSGETAAEYWSLVAQSAKRVTRLDIQVTWRQPQYDPNYARTQFGHAKNVRTGRARYPKLTFVDGDGSGDTLYLGSRKQQRFARLYDKQQESGEKLYENCWRAELELKGSVAQAAAEEMWGDDVTSTRIMDAVHRHFRQYGIYLGFNPSSEPALEFHVKRSTTDQSRLDWLEQQVAPALDKLIQKGLWAEAWEALDPHGMLREQLRVAERDIL